MPLKPLTDIDLELILPWRRSLPPRKILILSDAQSWINMYLDDLIMEWEAQGHDVEWRGSTIL